MNLHYYYFLQEFLSLKMNNKGVMSNIEEFELIDGKFKKRPVTHNLYPSPCPPTPWEFIHLMTFSGMDSIIDERHQEVMNESFEVRYKHLPSENDHQVIFRECYKAMMLIRHAIIHNRASIDTSASGIKIEKQLKNNKYNLIISNDAYDSLKYLCLLFFCHTEAEDAYSAIIMRHYYHQFRSGVTYLQNEAAIEFIELPIDVEFNPYHRYRYHIEINDLKKINGFFLIDRQEGIFEKKDLKGGVYRLDNCDEYLIKNSGVAKYLIPGYKLGKNGEISVDSLNEWKVGTKYFPYQNQATRPTRLAPSLP
ncbi:MAG: hypothetical protein U1F46_01990 [Marinagarivorans sp.]